VNVTLQRKKSLPDVQQIPINSMMSREEVSVLGSARREEVRRQKDESDRYRANPLLYLVSPQVKVTMHPSTLENDYHFFN
jgi:junctophilin